MSIMIMMSLAINCFIAGNIGIQQPMSSSSAGLVVRSLRDQSRQGSDQKGSFCSEESGFEQLRSISIAHWYRQLRNDLSGVVICIDVVNRDAGLAFFGRKHCFVDAAPVHAVAAIGRQE